MNLAAGVRHTGDSEMFVALVAIQIASATGGTIGGLTPELRLKQVGIFLLSTTREVTNLPVLLASEVSGTPGHENDSVSGSTLAAATAVAGPAGSDDHGDLHPPISAATASTTARDLQ